MAGDSKLVKACLTAPPSCEVEWRGRKRGRQTGVGGRVGRGRGAGAVGRAVLCPELKVVPASIPLTLATSLQFLRLCLSVGIAKVGVKLLLQLSNSSFGRLPLVKSVRGELCRASHMKEEVEGKSAGRVLRRELVSSSGPFICRCTSSTISRSHTQKFEK